MCVCVCVCVCVCACACVCVCVVVVVVVVVVVSRSVHFCSFRFVLFLLFFFSPFYSLSLLFPFILFTTVLFIFVAPLKLESSPRGG